MSEEALVRFLVGVKSLAGRSLGSTRATRKPRDPLRALRQLRKLKNLVMLRLEMHKASAS